MDKLDTLYAQLLAVGFVVLRQAIESGDQQWIHAELELLHNIPSLLGEDNLERHRYFWFQERSHYVRSVSKPGWELARSRMQTFYDPIFREMQPLLSDRLAQCDRQQP